MAATLDALQAECDAMRGYDPDWYRKMMHRIPPARVEDRVRYILDKCQGQRVLHLGCGWPPGYLHQAIEKVATVAYGIDVCVPEDCQTGDGFAQANLDSPGAVTALVVSLAAVRVGLVVCAEILEHLGNPGQLLVQLTRLACPVLITVPNAFSRSGYYHVTGGMEAVNPEHVSYYSYHTLKVLVERTGYRITDFCWYNGHPGTAEGLIMLVTT